MAMAIRIKEGAEDMLLVHKAQLTVCTDCCRKVLPCFRTQALNTGWQDSLRSQVESELHMAKSRIEAIGHKVEQRESCRVPSVRHRTSDAHPLQVGESLMTEVSPCP